MILYATDIDNTIIPKSTTEYKESIEKWANKIKNSKFKTAYASGRSFEMFKCVFETIPEPDFLITDVGTKIYYKNNKKWIEDIDFIKFNSQKWGRNDIRKYLCDIKEIKEQEKETLSEFKQSYYLEISENNFNTIQKIESVLAKEKIECEIIYSIDKNKNIGLIDIVPKGSGKSGAIKYLIKKLEIKENDVIYSGDSGNDIDALTEGWRAVLVGNASDEIKKEVKVKAKIRENLYIAEKYFTEGVLEGFEYFKI